MSYKRKSSKSNRPSNEVLKYCPNYAKFDKKARNESKTRINQHLSERRGGVKHCVDIAIKEFKILAISISKSAPRFIDNDEIINNAAKQTTTQINKWDGVQINQCKKKNDDGEMILIDTFAKFAKKAKNHQDQTSWKISGDYFFAPYIKKARVFLNEYCGFIQDITGNIRIEIQYLLCLSFANALFYEEIKFHRTKPKPLMRHRTLVKSNGIHKQLEDLHSSLTVRKFIQMAKVKRKTACGKSNIIAGDFFIELKKFVNQQYLKQKYKAYKLLNKSVDNMQCIINMDNNDYFVDICDDTKNSDINDDDHSIENDDIDIDIGSNSPSSTPPSVGYIYDKKSRKGKHKQRTFQNTNIVRKKCGKQNKYVYNKRVERQNKINKKCNLVRNKYCNNNNNNIHECEMENCDVSINALNSDFCSDCNNDTSTVSTIMTSSVSNNSMSPIRLPNTRYNNYHQCNQYYDESSIFTPAFIEKQKCDVMRQENEKLHQEIRLLRFKLEQKRIHNHHAPPAPIYNHHAPPMYNHQYIRPHYNYTPYQMQPIPPIQQPPMHINAAMEMDLPPGINDNNNEKLLFPDNIMVNDDNVTYKSTMPFDINNNQSMMMPNISVDPFPSFMAANINMSPQPSLNIDSSFL